MKTITSNSSIARWTGILGLATIFVGAVSLLPAKADDYTRDNRERSHIQRDIADIRRDQDRLHDLYHRRNWLADRHDWRAVHRLDDEITQLKWHIDHDRDDVHHDVQRLRRDEDSHYYSGHDGYDRDRYGSNSGYSSGYRVH